MKSFCPTFCFQCPQCKAAEEEVQRDEAAYAAIAEAEPVTIYDAARRIVKVCNRVLHQIGPAHPLYAQLQEAAAELEGFEQDTDDPRQNGWVGSDGLP